VRAEGDKRVGAGEVDVEVAVVVRWWWWRR